MGGKEVFDEIKVGPEMTVLDIVSQYRSTVAVFKNYDLKAGVCICCEALFEPLAEVASKYGLNLDDLIRDLKSAAE